MPEAWTDLPAPSVVDTLSARTLDHTVAQGCFWAKDLDNDYLLVLERSRDSSPTPSLPHVREIEINGRDGLDDGRRMLIRRLLDQDQRDIFASLCRAYCGLVWRRRDGVGSGCDNPSTHTIDLSTCGVYRVSLSDLNDSLWGHHSAS